MLDKGVITSGELVIRVPMKEIQGWESFTVGVVLA